MALAQPKESHVRISIFGEIGLYITERAFEKLSFQFHNPIEELIILLSAVLHPGSKLA